MITCKKKGNKYFLNHSVEILELLPDVEKGLDKVTETLVCRIHPISTAIEAFNSNNKFAQIKKVTKQFSNLANPWEPIVKLESGCAVCFMSKGTLSNTCVVLNASDAI